VVVEALATVILFEFDEGISSSQSARLEKTQGRLEKTQAQLSDAITKAADAYLRAAFIQKAVGWRHLGEDQETALRKAMKADPTRDLAIVHLKGDIEAAHLA